MRNILRSVQLVALLLSLATWVVPKESHSKDSSPGRTAAPTSISRTDAGSSQKPDFVSWSRQDCQEILKKHTKNIGVSDMHMETVILGGIGKMMEAEVNYFVWLTEPAAKAYARIIQLKTHLSDTEAEEVYRRLRPSDSQFITVVMFSRSMELGLTKLAGITIDEGDKPDKLGSANIDFQKSLFLVTKSRNGQEQAARIERIEPLPDDVIAPTVSRLDSAYGALIRFSKTTQDTKPLVESLKDEVVVSFYRLGKPRKTTFKIKAFRISSLNEL